MGRKSKFTTEEKLVYVFNCLEEKDSILHTASIIGKRIEIVLKNIGFTNTITTMIMEPAHANSQGSIHG